MKSLSKAEQYKLAWQWARMQANAALYEVNSFGDYGYAVFPTIDILQIDSTLLGDTQKLLVQRKVMMRSRARRFVDRIRDHADDGFPF